MATWILLCQTWMMLLTFMKIKQLRTMVQTNQIGSVSNSQEQFQIAMAWQVECQLGQVTIRHIGFILVQIYFLYTSRKRFHLLQAAVQIYPTRHVFNLQSVANASHPFYVRVGAKFCLDDGYVAAKTKL